MKFLVFTCLILCVQMYIAKGGLILNKIKEELHANHNRTTDVNGDLNLGFLEIKGGLSVNHDTGLDVESSDGNTSLDLEHKKKVNGNFEIHGKPIIHNLLHPDDQQEYNIKLTHDRETDLHLGSKVGNVLSHLAQ